jgi:hypothetical protein
VRWYVAGELLDGNILAVSNPLEISNPEFPL